MNPIVEDWLNMWIDIWKGTLVAVTFGNPVMTMELLDSLIYDDDDDDEWEFEIPVVWEWLH